MSSTARDQSASPGAKHSAEFGDAPSEAIFEFTVKPSSPLHVWTGDTILSAGRPAPEGKTPAGGAYSGLYVDAV
jgi:hypothetical protein